MLLLFDIDQTMIDTQGAGKRAMLGAGRELFGSSFSFEGIAVAGRLDPLIVHDLFAANGVRDTREAREMFRRRYVERLGEELNAPGSRVLPGVVSLLTSLRERHANEATLGVLTGNWEESGRLKLDRLGVKSDWFAVHVWGDEGRPREGGALPRREDLVPVGFERYEKHHGGRRVLRPEQVVVIGDTEHDIACARAHGCRSLGVGTGRTSAEELARAGADLALPTLEDTSGVIAWLLEKSAQR